ncbi:hypothetical protein JQ636_35505 [Bradyrhizobium japonicum]|uniref:hypothetical protein n=1 Tax=Bradyrhizobium japonicum TaxID=375 RepID=UPI001BACCE2F|nr:hypothetical protein [Bradyrhizobium japonicum]MBR0733809.1 hypothetical protein [Bradyrhizobium japonicum]MBR0808867.1 hypothetical protein [Bradyrhizobium japonicum]
MLDESRDLCLIVSISRWTILFGALNELGDKGASVIVLLDRAKRPRNPAGGQAAQVSDRYSNTMMAKPNAKSAPSLVEGLVARRSEC